MTSGYILVAGGMGYIGSHVVVNLIRSGHSVVIADNLANSRCETLDMIKEVLRLEEIEFEESQLLFRDVDLTVMSQVESIFNSLSVKSVIALAGLKAVGESIDEPPSYYRTNINIVTNLIETMSRNNCFHLIFSSSSTVYGKESVPYIETQSIGNDISNPYGFTKYLIEKILMNLCKFQPKWRITSLRYFNPVGCHSSGMLADNPKAPSNLIPVLMRSIISGLPFKIFGIDYETEDGSAERDYIHVSDLANAHICALEKAPIGYHVYNVGLGKPVSVYKVIEAFERVNKIKLNYETAPKRQGDLASYYAICTKAKSELDWSPKLDLDSIVRDCYSSLKYY